MNFTEFYFSAPSVPPNRVSAVSSNSTSIHLSWNPPPVEQQNGEIDFYIVVCIELNTGATLSRHRTEMTDTTITGLHPYYTYRCNVSAITVGEGPFSDSVEVTTLEDSKLEAS